MAKRDRVCYLCGEKYQYCPTCGNDRLKPSWMSQFHSENCKNIFEICTKFNMELITKEEAANELKKCDLSNKENFDKVTLETVNKIVGAPRVEQKVAEVKKQSK